MAIYLFRQIRGEGLDEICGEFGLKRYSSAGSVIEKVKVQLSKEREFKKRVEKMKSMLHKRQTETPMAHYHRTPPKRKYIADHLKSLTRDEGATAAFVYDIIHYCILLSTKSGHRHLTDSQSHARGRIVKQL